MDIMNESMKLGGGRRRRRHRHRRRRHQNQRFRPCISQRSRCRRRPSLECWMMFMVPCLYHISPTTVSAFANDYQYDTMSIMPSSSSSSRIKITDPNFLLCHRRQHHHHCSDPSSRILQQKFNLYATQFNDDPITSNDVSTDGVTTKIDNNSSSTSNTPLLRLDEIWLILQIMFLSTIVSLILISWEDISMYHPMRVEYTALSSSKSSSSSSSWGQSTVCGMGFGRSQRDLFSSSVIAGDLESNEFATLRSYNEIMADHRTNRIPSFTTTGTSISSTITEKDDSIWKNLIQRLQHNQPTSSSDSSTLSSSSSTTQIPQERQPTEQNVIDSIHHMKLVLLKIQDMKTLSANYEWDTLRSTINEPLMRSQLNEACYVLKHANSILTSETREVVGFDWGSCAWRHCGALADIQESLDELDASIGVLEPFEALFCIDVVERSVRDILDAMPTTLLQKTQDRDDIRQLSQYEPLKRMSDVDEDDRMDGMDRDYMEALEFLRTVD